MNGTFVTLEGTEGAGKSTLVAAIREELGHGRELVLTREPGGTAAGDGIRSVLLNPALRVDSLTEYLLYAASRAQHVAEVIRPALERGALVICDRFTASSVAYQGAGRGVDQELIRQLNGLVTQDLKPDLTILLDLPVSEGLGRIAARGEKDRLEQADIDFHERVAASYREQARQPGWVTVDATMPAEKVREAVLQAIRTVAG